MSELEKMKQAIAQAPKCCRRYGMSWEEMEELMDHAEHFPMDTIFISFSYGRVKGYQAAKVERGRRDD